MSKFLLITLTIIISMNLSAEQEDKSSSSIQVENNEDSKHLSELPKFEQYVHQSLTSKLNLLHVHQDFIMRQSTILIKFMETLEDEKDGEGKIEKKRLAQVIEQSRFPKVVEMRPFLEKLKDDEYIGYKIESLLDNIFQDDTKAVYDWFTLLETEILTDINNYEKADISLPQYRYILNMYTDSKNSQRGIAQMMPLMSPNVFKN